VISPEISNGTFCSSPFQHYIASKGLTEHAAASFLDWFQNGAPWHLVEADFYEQYELNLCEIDLPNHLKLIRDKENLSHMRSLIESTFSVTLTDRVDLTAHKLLQGQTIRIHNDFIPGAETHRILIQLNSGWSDNNGGLLIFFNSDNPTDINRALRPLHNSCVAFAIGPNSLHAVSTISASERYTLVCSFYEYR